MHPIEDAKLEFVASHSVWRVLGDTLVVHVTPPQYVGSIIVRASQRQVKFGAIKRHIVCAAWRVRKAGTNGPIGRD